MFDFGVSFTLISSLCICLLIIFLDSRSSGISGEIVEENDRKEFEEILLYVKQRRGDDHAAVVKMLYDLCRPSMDVHIKEYIKSTTKKAGD